MANKIDASRKAPRGVAFTLLELLIVIAVIAILACLIIGGIASARDSAHKTACASNLRQLALSLQMYVNDSKDYPPLYSYPWRNGGKMWFDDLQPYTHQSWTNPLYLCPSYAGPPTTAGTVSDAGFQQPVGSYGYNIGGVGANWSQQDLGLGGGVNMVHPQIIGTHEPRVRVSDDMIALGDAYAADNSGRIWPDHGVVGINFRGINSGLTDQANKRHHGKLNIVFCDGHTLAPKVQALLFNHSDEALRRWNNDHEPHRELLSP